MSSKVIKAIQPEAAAFATSGHGKVVDRVVYTAQERADRILTEAQARAEAMLAEAERQTASVIEQASLDGHRDGLAVWQERSVDLIAAYNRMLSEVRPQLIDIALEASRKILRHQLREVPAAIQGSIDEALRVLRNASPSRLDVIVHPEDMAAVEELCARLRDKDPRWGAMVLEADSKMARGGCRLVSDFGEVDASVETQLATMRRLLNQEEPG